MGQTSPRAGWFHRKGWAQALIAAPYLWLVAFFLAPFAIVVAMSLARSVGASPPFAYGDGFPFVTLENFARLATDGLYLRAFLTSITTAALTTVICMVIGYPMALGIARARGAARAILLLLVILPFWTSFLLRVYAWIGMMGTNSWFNRGLTGLYNLLVPAEEAIRAIPMMNTGFAVVLVMVYSYLPFMILPLYANLERLDRTLDEAAMDLGSRPAQVFRDVTLPLSVPGIIAGGLLVFIPASGELIVPSLVGNAADPMIGRVIADEFGSARNWPMASAVAVALLAILVLPAMVYARSEARAQGAAEERP